LHFNPPNFINHPAVLWKRWRLDKNPLPCIPPLLWSAPTSDPFAPMICERRRSRRVRRQAWARSRKLTCSTKSETRLPPCRPQPRFPSQPHPLELHRRATPLVAGELRHDCSLPACYALACHWPARFPSQPHPLELHRRATPLVAGELRHDCSLPACYALACHWSLACSALIRHSLAPPPQPVARLDPRGCSPPQTRSPSLYQAEPGVVS
jgi:hypothetical protein